MAEVTNLLMQWRSGNDAAFDELWRLVYEDLRQIAVREFHRERRPDHTLQPTALVHESYLRMVGTATSAQNRQHFLALAALVIRRVLVDHARNRDRQKREGSYTRTTSDHTTLTSGFRFSTHVPDILALDAALNRLSGMDETATRIVEMRFFGGMTVQETADELAISKSTAMRKWKFARVWLYGELTTKKDDS